MLTGEQVIQHALTWQGVPYRMVPDATTRAYADCSGFVVGVFRELGYPFPEGVRDVEAIRQVCQPVTAAPDWDNGRVQRGDLLFFGYPGARGGDAHVGFALLNGWMLDANASRGSVGLTLLQGWYQEALYECRRPPQLLAPQDYGADQRLAELEAYYTYTQSLLGLLLNEDGELLPALEAIRRQLAARSPARQPLEAVLARLRQLREEWRGT